MKKYKLSKKGNQLINMYNKMIDGGYFKVKAEENLSYVNFEIRPLRKNIKKIFKDYNIKSVLDYGSGGSDWNKSGFDVETEKSAKQYFELDKINKFDPAMNVDERCLSDCVVCFDVLEHIFISDVRNLLLDIFQYANHLVVLNIACYEAGASLPNGENAHITVRHPFWWKGVVDTVAQEFKEVSVILTCSTEYRKFVSFKAWNAKMWDEDKNFKIDY